MFVSNDKAINALPHWTVDLKNNFYIIAKPIARLIYFVICFDFTYHGDRPLESFSTLEFFRFSVDSDKRISDKHKLNIRLKKNVNTDVIEISAKHNAPLSLDAIIQKVVHGLTCFSSIAKRPSLLHIYPWSYYTEARDLILYKTLRIPSAEIFKQVFYTVSYLDELKLLFDKLMDKFKFNILLRDSKESVEEAYSLFNSIEREKATKREKERDARDIEKDNREKEIAKKTNTMLTYIILISVASVLFDFYIFSGLDEYMGLKINEKFSIHVIFSVLTLMGVYFAWRHITRSVPLQDSDIASR